MVQYEPEWRECIWAAGQMAFHLPNSTSQPWAHIPSNSRAPQAQRGFLLHCGLCRQLPRIQTKLHKMTPWATLHTSNHALPGGGARTLTGTHRGDSGGWREKRTCPLGHQPLSHLQPYIHPQHSALEAGSGPSHPPLPPVSTHPSILTSNTLPMVPSLPFPTSISWPSPFKPSAESPPKPGLSSVLHKPLP